MTDPSCSHVNQLLLTFWRYPYWRTLFGGIGYERAADNFDFRIQVRLSHHRERRQNMRRGRVVPAFFIAMGSKQPSPTGFSGGS